MAGSFAALALTAITLNISSFMGVIMVAGITAKNGILLLDRAERGVAAGIAPPAALADAAMVRLRPIVMTTLATIIGLLPMALKLGTGSESYAPLARVIIGGLVASVILTVFVVPAAYLLIYHRREGSQAPLIAEEVR